MSGRESPVFSYNPLNTQEIAGSPSKYKISVVFSYFTSLNVSNKLCLPFYPLPTWLVESQLSLVTESENSCHLLFTENVLSFFCLSLLDSRYAVGCEEFTGYAQSWLKCESSCGQYCAGATVLIRLMLVESNLWNSK